MCSEVWCLSGRDLAQIRSIGREPAAVIAEIEALRKCAAQITLVGPCVYPDGVVRFSPSQQAKWEGVYRHKAPRRTIVKFVAASGAASRMFRALQSYLGRPARTGTRDDSDTSEVRTFLDRVSEFAFFPQLQSVAASRGWAVESLLASGRHRQILEYILCPSGLNYATLPKGLIPYHRYPDGSRTAIEEHLVEATGYAKGADGVIPVHFTVAPEHSQTVSCHLEAARRRFERQGIRYKTTTSVQAESTNTIALDPENNPVRDHAGRLIFKPSGHGALLNNLNSLQGDIIFLKTVDNVLPDPLHGIVCFHKRVLAGYLIAIEERLHAYLRLLSSGSHRPGVLRRIQLFVESKLFVRFPAGFDNRSVADKAEFLYNRLNRPLRVCGVVPHEGDSGGAPFWVRDTDGTDGLRIVEEREVTCDSEEQSRLWQCSRYFNPVDIVCSLRDFLGRPFHLPDYSDPAASFVTFRWHRNQQIKILERPGLWNGGMAHWNTVFVEVPRITVHPVKRILDLLSWQHCL